MHKKGLAHFMEGNSGSVWLVLLYIGNRKLPGRRFLAQHASNFLFFYVLITLPSDSL